MCKYVQPHFSSMGHGVCSRRDSRGQSLSAKLERRVQQLLETTVQGRKGQRETKKQEHNFAAKRTFREGGLPSIRDKRLGLLLCTIIRYDYHYPQVNHTQSIIGLALVSMSHTLYTSANRVLAIFPNMLCWIGLDGLKSMRVYYRK